MTRGTIDWSAVAADLQAQGWALLPGLVTAAGCAQLRGFYGKPELFRSKVVMARHGYGKGEYQYFKYPLPAPVAKLRAALYPPLARIANGWNEAMGVKTRYPASHDAYRALCHKAGQARPTPLLLKYQAGDYNCLHQDLYGAESFPLQATILLSRPQKDFTGGEFVLTEQRPRMQSRPAVAHLMQGDAVVFAVNQRPVKGARGIYRVRHRHGVATVTSGNRMTAGIIFHDAA